MQKDDVVASYSVNPDGQAHKQVGTEKQLPTNAWKSDWPTMEATLRFSFAEEWCEDLRGFAAC